MTLGKASGRAQERKGSISKAAVKGQPLGVAAALTEGGSTGPGEPGVQAEEKLLGSQRVWLFAEESCPAHRWAERTGSELPITR